MESILFRFLILNKKSFNYSDFLFLWLCVSIQIWFESHLTSDSLFLICLTLLSLPGYHQATIHFHWRATVLVQKFEKYIFEQLNVTQLHSYTFFYINNVIITCQTVNMTFTSSEAKYIGILLQIWFVLTFPSVIRWRWIPDFKSGSSIWSDIRFEYFKKLLFE